MKKKEFLLQIDLKVADFKSLIINKKKGFRSCDAKAFFESIIRVGDIYKTGKCPINDE